MKYYGPSIGEQGHGIGDIVEGYDWKKTSDGYEIKDIKGNWIQVYNVFNCRCLEYVD